MAFSLRVPVLTRRLASWLRQDPRYVKLFCDCPPHYILLAPKVLYEPMPVIYIYAINTTAGRDNKLYESPIYRKPGRTEINYIGSIDFESDISPKHWAKRGVALLCDIK